MPVYAFIFPGQGSQFAGMGRDLAAAFAPAREVFEEVDDALGERLSKLMFSGPIEELTLTQNTQPALMAVSLAVLRVLQRDAGLDVAAPRGRGGRAFARRVFGPGGGRQLRCGGRRPGCCGGAAPRCSRRCRSGEGGMAALLGTGIEQAREICVAAAVMHAEGKPDRVEVIEVANDNGGGQVVISGAAGRDRARHRDRKGARHPSRDAAAGLGTVPLLPDGACGGRHARGTRRRSPSQRPACR